ncbi:MAG: BREX-1 system adenine-specific DNA-methyltransferase PglX, partial [Anaerolineales bacterium]
MEKETRNRIRNTVLEVRRLLESDVADQLEGVYGIARSGKAQSPQAMPTLQEDPVLRYRRGQIDAALKHDRDTGLSSKESVARFIHETTYTVLNRLVAVRMLEVRGLLRREAVAEGHGSAGFKDFQKVCPQVCQARPDGGYQLFLELLFDELAASIRPLFDRGGPHSIIFPSWKKLEQVLARLNDSDLASVWAADETIGWVYQYFNIPDREAVRQQMKGRQLPQKSQDVAVINQFYTPRYIVEFLVDNTLGRLWLETCGDETRLAESCRMLVRRPDEPLRHRELKDPQEIKVLDPAVGSGHFLHYAFDLLTIMYEERGYDPAEIPALILDNNLFGIDIDPRAVQLAAFTLYLRARAYEQAHGAPARARLPTANLVVAEPMPGDKRLFEEFVADQLQVVQNVCRRVWDLLALAAEAGSLLKVEMAFDEAIIAEQARLAKEPLLDTEKLLDDATFWDELEGRIVGLFHDYYRRALAQADVSRALFATEGEQGFRFLDLLRQDYDVVLMNPPFTRTTQKANSYINKHYDYWHSSLLCAFVNRALTFVRREGSIGSVLDRSVLIKSSYKKFRDSVVLQNSRLTHLVDLGWDVLDDANVEVSTFILEKGIFAPQADTLAWCVDITDEDVCKKHTALAENVERTITGLNSPKVYWADTDDFRRLPNYVFGYYIPSFVRTLFTKLPAISEILSRAVQGHAIKVDNFYRYFWEVKRDIIGMGLDYALLYNGGPYSKYYLPERQIIYWKKDGAAVREHPSTVLRNKGYHFRPGVGYGKRGTFIDAHMLGSGHIFTVEGLVSFPHEALDRWLVLGLLNSSLCQMVLNTYCGQHKHVGYVNLLPVPEKKEAEEKSIAQLAHEAYWLKAQWYLGDETNLVFDKPWLLREMERSQLEDLSRLVDMCIDQENFTNERLQSLEDRLDEAVFRLYGIEEESDRAQVMAAVEDRPEDIAWIEQRGATVSQRRHHHVQALLSFLVGCLFGRWDYVNGSFLHETIEGIPILKRAKVRDLTSAIRAKEAEVIGGQDALVFPIQELLPTDAINQARFIEYPVKILSDGIAVVDPGHPRNLVTLVKDLLETTFTQASIAETVVNFLGVSSLDEYFSRRFFDFHIDVYQKKPIYWQLTTPSKGYSLWLYYHALGPETLYTAVREYVTPKIEFEEGRLKELQAKFDQVKESGPAREARRLEKQQFSFSHFEAQASWYHRG